MTDEIKSPGSLLADEMYATPAVDPVNGAKDPALLVEPDPAVETDPVIEPDDDAPEIKAEDENNEDEGVDIHTFEELAEHLETDTDFLRGLSVTEKVNGKQIEVPIAEALATHRKVKAADSYLSEAKDKAKTIVDEVAQQKERYAESIAEFAVLIQSVEQELEGDIKKTDWAGLRKDDPAEYSAKTLEVKERRDRLLGMRQQAAQTYQQLVAQSTEKEEQQKIESLPQEQEALLSRIPEWSDESKAAKEQTEVVSYLTADGFSEQEIGVASFNGKLLAMAIKAMRYDNSKDKSQAAKKKVVKIPKVLKPGSKSSDAKPNASGDDPVSILYGSS